ncbi:hypothetical protein RC1_3313 [Rhodospirillum centenum SW]|uniref:Uncharacterized protein n=2 Tax=Rhodospirillum centenum TaxID=34018 RepID=B6IWK0_RHOCS|nr:hypothetical protein RC1_3313 [Rhodospirillum centenum SW]
MEREFRRDLRDGLERVAGLISVHQDAGAGREQRLPDARTDAKPDHEPIRRTARSGR